MYFFALRSEVPDDVGFSLFGPVHLAWLAGIIAFVAVTLRLLRGHERALAIAARATAVASVGLVILLEAFFWARDALTVFNLPLELCLLSPFICLIYSLTGWDWAGQTSYCLGLPGAVAALLFPSWTVFPQWNLVNLQSFLLHATLVLYPLLEVERGRLAPRLSHIWKPIVFLVCVVPFIYAFNLRFGTNYFFLMSGSPGSPLELLIGLFGTPGFLVAYAAIVLVAMVAMYLPFEHGRRKELTHEDG